MKQMKRSPMRPSQPWQSATNRLRHLASLACLMVSACLLQAATPADPIVELRFSEAAGTTTANTGSLGGTATFNFPPEWPDFPTFTNSVPAGTYVPAGNTSGVDMGRVTGTAAGGGTFGRAVDLSTDLNDPGLNAGSLGDLVALTVCGWINLYQVGSQNYGRIAFAHEGRDGAGFDLIHDLPGALRLGINQRAESAPPSETTLTADSDMGDANWVFFAATYDSTAGSDHLKYYFGRPDKLAALDSSHTYVGGEPAFPSAYTGTLTVGNFSMATGDRDRMGNASSGIVRGRLDEIVVYDRVLDLDEVQQAQLNSAVTPVAPTILQQPSDLTVGAGLAAVFLVEASGSGLISYQWKTNGVDVAGATSARFALTEPTLALDGTTVTVLVGNSVDSVLSDEVTLNVLPANPNIISVSFLEGNVTSTNYALSENVLEISTANSGILGGQGDFLINTGGDDTGTYPVFSINVPTGPFAPNPTYNRFSLNMGDVLLREDGSPPSSQGGRAVDFVNGNPGNSLGSMDGLTICGWLNAGALSWRTSSGGVNNQIVSALDATEGNGFGLAHKADGSLQLGVNQRASNNLQNRSSVDLITNDTNHPPENWIFFAVTYDGTQASQNLKFYFGKPDTAAALDLTLDYPQGVIASSGSLSVGNFNAETPISGRTINGNNAAFFRGLIDELQIFNEVKDLATIQTLQVAPAFPPVLHITPPVGEDVTVSWQANRPFKLQAKPDVITSGGWTDVLTAPTVTDNISSVDVPTGDGDNVYRLREN